MFHKHNFKKEGLNIWCECGKIKKLNCSHDWVVHSEKNIRLHTGEIQIQQILKCKCGKLKSLNLTTGETN